MTYEDYQQKLDERFGKREFIPSLKAEMCYEEKFQMKWIFTKLKQFTFISKADTISGEAIKTYSAGCIDYALKKYKGLPRGVQNGVGSYSVMVSDNVDESAIVFATSRPKKHFSAFEMPVIVDLKNQRLYYYNKTPLWGAVYYKHFREYIERNFSL